jgi:hypothetical protein
MHMNDDASQIDKIVDKFFTVFTTKNNGLPDIEALYHVCLPEILLIRKAGAVHTAYTLHSFASSRQKILTDGTLTEFEEREVSEETQISSNIAQRCSRYEKSGVLDGKYFQQKGCKLFQFVKSNDSWKISALVWEDEDVTT